MRIRALASVAALALSGCAMPVERPGSLGMAWSLETETPDGARLVLGRPGTADQRLSMACQPRSGMVEVTVAGRAGSGAVIDLHSGKVWNRYPGAGVADGGMMNVRARLSAEDPVLVEFASKGALTVIFDQRQIIAPNGFAPAHDFVAICRRRD
jgi:hypothetical protein